MKLHIVKKYNFRKRILFQNNLKQWVIPENIHTIPHTASWNSEGEGSFLDWNSKGMGEGGAQLHVCSLGFQRHGGVSALNSVNFLVEDSESFA